MYLPWEKIGLTLRYLLPQYGRDINDLFEKLRIDGNVNYIRNNTRKTLIRLRKKVKSEKIKVAFICSEPSKWKCQTLFDLMQKDKHFEPFILATRIDKNTQTPQYAIDTYEFFRSKNMPVKYAYDTEKNTYLHSRDFDADIIFYQQPWSNETTQGPVVASKYALTCYVPYFVATSESWIEYGLRFHQYINKHYVLNNLIKNEFSQKMKNKGRNLVVTGHPQLDYFYFNKNNDSDKKYVIYAPHHSIDDIRLNWATFRWSANFMLDYAKKHPEINWVFKPHPYLKITLRQTNTMTKQEMDKYWNEWREIADVHETGDYLDLFMNSYAMISDGGSFLTEYLFTGSPLIHMERDDSVPFNSSVNKILTGYYRARNEQELEKLLDEVVINLIDKKKDDRKRIMDELDMAGHAAMNILNDLKKELYISE